MVDSSDVKGFYDRFSDEVLLEDFRRVNLRQEAIKELCGKYVPKGCRVLEIGCGVGIIAGHLKKTVGRYVGVDISERNVEIAREYVRDAGFEFKVLDVIEKSGELDSCGLFDVVILPDVIEHIPKDRYKVLFEVIERHLDRPGVVLFTFPSPEYQEHLKANDPSALQVVDETVELGDLLRHTSLKLHFFAYRDVWNRNQYIHAALVSDLSFLPGGVERGVFWKVGYRIRKYLWRIGNASFVNRVRSRLKPRT
jgi:trans-aconitate 2-methyltransferase